MVNLTKMPKFQKETYAYMKRETCYIYWCFESYRNNGYFFAVSCLKSYISLLFQKLAL